MTKEELISRVHNNHTHHPPKDEAMAKLHERVRASTEYCAMELVKLCPVGRELSLALTAMEEVMFWANAAIARGE